MSVVEICVHMQMLYITCNTEVFSYTKFYSVYITFGAFYIVILCLIYSYISQLSYERRLNIKNIYRDIVFFVIVYSAIILFPLLTNRLLIFEDGKIILSQWANSYLACGIIMAICALCNIIRYSKTLSRVVWIGTMIFAPLDILALCVQFFFPTLVISSSTYVLPLLLFYLLFHSPLYDETVGSQNDKSFYAFLHSEIRRKRKYILLYCKFPQLQKHEFSSIQEEIVYMRAMTCREIERIKHNVHIYTRNHYTYLGYSRIKNEKQAKMAAQKAYEILSREHEVRGVQMHPVFHAIAIRNDEILDSSAKVQSLISFLTTRFEDENVSKLIEVNDQILKEFETYYNIENVLEDIKQNADYDDERILCFTQPIRTVDTGEYRTAEALMRMKVDGRMYFPDQFIPVAEKNDSIHTLTLVILTKICKLVKKLEEEGYDFDAFTINCSTQELGDDAFAEDIMGIIVKNNVSPERIRLEITESTTISNYATIISNIEKLNTAGVRFYLDDFGTGYSNMERIVSYPFMTIKFDKSMLYKALEDKTANELMSVLVGFFKNNGFHMLVEGVEDEAQSMFAKEKGFEYIQGYYYSKPVEAEQITEFFVQR